MLALHLKNELILNGRIRYTINTPDMHIRMTRPKYNFKMLASKDMCSHVYSLVGTYLDSPTYYQIIWMGWCHCITKIGDTITSRQRPSCMGPYPCNKVCVPYVVVSLMLLASLQLRSHKLVNYIPMEIKRIVPF